MATDTLPVARVSAPLTAIPRQLTRFVGRELELAEVGHALESSRLVTLTGAGGSGKTRLAAELGRRRADRFADGAAWVDLAPLTDPTLLARHVGAALGLGEDLARSPAQVLTDRLKPLALLLVLDNCEHLVAECAVLAHGLLSACPELTILTTSREALGVDGEVAWAVPPLSLPASVDPVDAEGISHSEAVQLFVGRARAVRSGFELTDRNAPAVARICRRLDGIPLAIELAAARVKALPAEQIADRLDDVFRLLTTGSRTGDPRHRTLRDAIDWSHDLLDDDERVVFRRLAVFSGRFSLAAAERVCSGGRVDEGAVLDHVSALVDKSLLRAESQRAEARFSFLEPVRQYALARLDESGETEALRGRHADHFLALAEEAEPWLRGGTRGAEWMVRLEPDRDNLRAAAEWLAAAPERAEQSLRLDTALLWFYFAQGIFLEPRHRLTRALEQAVDATPLVSGRAHAALGFQAIWQGDLPAIAGPLARAVELLRGCADPEGLALALTGLGMAIGASGDAPAAYALFDEVDAVLGGREHATARGYPYLFLYAFGSYWRGVVLQLHGDLPGAGRAFATCVAVARDMSNHPTMAHPLGALARIHALTGDLAAARACLAESLPIHARNDDRWGLADALDAAALLAAGEHDTARAARLVGAADGVRASLGLCLQPHLQAHRDALVDRIREGLGGIGLAEALATGREMTVAEVIDDALGRGPTRRIADRTAPGSASRTSSPSAGGAPGSTDRTGHARLRVRALGPLEVELDGEPLAGGSWGTSKPRELLIYLLCHPSGATREQIGRALWPDASSERVSNNFHVTVHRLRKALGDGEWIAKSGERYLLDPTIPRDFDADELERALDAALGDLRAGRDGAARLTDALSLWRGPFLQDEVVGDWHLEVGDRLRRLHVDGLLALGAHLFEQSRYADAAEAYRRVIATDDLHEEGYRRLMLSLARSGDRSQALRLYQRLVALLEREVDARPEPETVALYARLQGAGAV